jgi:hypothetical protein
MTMSGAPVSKQSSHGLVGAGAVAIREEVDTGLPRDRAPLDAKVQLFLVPVVQGNGESS